MLVELESTPMECVLGDVQAFCAGTRRSPCFVHRLALFAATLLLFQEFTLCLADYYGLCSRSPTGRHEKVRKMVPVRVQCEGGCGATETRHFEWNGCKHCETTDWVATVHKSAKDLRECKCRRNRRSRDGDVYFDMGSTWESNRDSSRDSSRDRGRGSSRDRGRSSNRDCGRDRGRDSGRGSDSKKCCIQ